MFLRVRLQVLSLDVAWRCDLAMRKTGIPCVMAAVALFRFGNTLARRYMDCGTQLPVCCAFLCEVMRRHQLK